MRQGSSGLEPAAPPRSVGTSCAVNDGLESVHAWGVLGKAGACKFLGDISQDKLMDLVRAGRLNAKQLDARVVFEVAELQRFIEELPSWEPRR